MSTSSPQKSASSSQNLADGPDFASWKQETLAQIAGEMYEKMREQEDQLEQLRQDLKTALEAYRALLRL